MNNNIWPLKLGRFAALAFWAFLFIPVFPAWGDEVQDIYSRVFGNALVETELAVFINGKDAGEIPVRIQGEEVTAFSRATLGPKLELLIKKDRFSGFSGDSEWLSPEELPYPYTYDPGKLAVKFLVPMDHLLPVFADMGNDPRIKYAGSQSMPAPFGGGVSYVFERSFGDEYLGGDYFSTYYDGFVNLNGYVLSSQGRYEEDIENSGEGQWHRGDTNITKDFISQRTRLQVGDTVSSSFGFMSARQVGGASLRRQFSIDPYRKPFPQGDREITLQNRSRVKTYVNGSLIKDETMPAGNYKLRNLPLIDGLNFVRVEVEDEFGQKRVIAFNLPTAVSILREGETDFSFTYGSPFRDERLRREYADEKFASGFAQYGFSDFYSAGGYGQSEDEFTLLGTIHGISSEYGNFFLEGAGSNHQDGSGNAQALSWRYQRTGVEIGGGFSLMSRYENYQRDFSRTREFFDAPLKESLDASISMPILSGVTLSAGVGRATYQDSSLPMRKKANLSGNWRINNSMNINFFASSVTDRSGNENHAASAFFTWSLGDGLVSVFRDVENESTRLSYQSGNYNELYRPRFNASVEESANGQRGDVGAQIPTPMADFHLRTGAAKDGDNNTHSLTSLRLASSVLFARDEKFAYAIARPGSNSFALFSPSDNLQGQKVALRSTSPYADTVTPLAGDLALTNLVPYQYREVEVDPTLLDNGTSLKREKFVLLPGYKTAHLIKIEDKGLRSVEGSLTRNGDPVALKVGRLGDIGFFTNREGYFYIEGVPAGESRLEIDGSVLDIEITEEKRGIFDLGEIDLE